MSTYSCSAPFLSLNWRVILSVLLLGALFSVSSNAELYRWVDENGKTHFSDQPPQNADIASTVVDIDDTDEAVDIDDAAVKRSDDQASRMLLITDADALWNRSIVEKQHIGLYYLGKECAISTTMVLPDAKDMHRDMFPSNSSLSTTVVSAMRSFRYPARRNYGQKIRSLSDAYTLDLTVENIDMAVCISGRSSLANINLEKISSAAFKKHRMTLTTTWILRDANEQKLFTGTFKGHSNLWQGRHHLHVGYRNAIKHAVAQLLADETFNELILTLPPEKASESAVNDEPESPLQIGENADKPSGIGELTGLFTGYFKQSQFSKVLQIVQPAKMGVTEYYMMHGQWPSHIGELQGVPTAHASSGVNQVSIEREGTIVLDLDEKFGNDARLYMRPLVDDSASLIDWQCESNVDPAYIPKGLECVSVQ
ncbi:DUF4124 domain-containing protein [bacterium]|nr:DUF4124 domain-containing protein [bacterium]